MSRRARATSDAVLWAFVLSAGVVRHGLGWLEIWGERRRQWHHRLF